MQIRFSRHARRRMKLYDIDETDVEDVVLTKVLGSPGIVGRVEVVEERFENKYRYPLKVVFVVENEQIEIVTAYPLKGKNVR